MKKVTVIIGFVLLCASCSIGRSIGFKEDDTNGDQKISYEEFESKLKVQQGLKDYAKLKDISEAKAVKIIFNKYDIDKSNDLSKKEFSEFLKKGW